MPTVEVNGVDIWYQFSGIGETVVQIGGAVSAHEGYATITPELSKHYRVLDYDHRGYGLSSRPEQDYTLEVWSADLAALMEVLEVERAHIHGGSMGSFIALDFAACYPEKVDKLLMGAGAVAKCDAMGVYMFQTWQDVASAYGVVSVELARELLAKAFSRAFLDEMGDELLWATKDVLERNTSLPVFIDACQAMIDTDVRGHSQGRDGARPGHGRFRRHPYTDRCRTRRRRRPLRGRPPSQWADGGIRGERPRPLRRSGRPVHRGDPGLPGRLSRTRANGTH